MGPNYHFFVSFFIFLAKMGTIYHLSVPRIDSLLYPGVEFIKKKIIVIVFIGGGTY